MSQLRDASERSYKSIVFEVLPQAIASERSVSGRLDQRGLYYAARRLYLAHPERPLELEARMRAQRKTAVESPIDYNYFGNRIVPEYEEAFGEIPGLIRDVRGHLHAPHTYPTDAQAIGTEFVEGYEVPEYYFDKCIFVEKEGVAQGLVDQGLGKRFDAAIIGAKGYRTEAIGDLLHLFSEEGYEVYILHDCDVHGYAISANLQDGNMRVHALPGEVIDLGMSLEDALGMGLLGEPATRQSAIPAGVVSKTPAEHALFTGVQISPKAWQYKRFELNEIPARQRFPFVERKLLEAGVGPKVIPPDEYMQETAEGYVESNIESITDTAIAELLARESKARMVEQFKDRYDLGGLREAVEEGLAQHLRSDWRGEAFGHVYDLGRELAGEIREAVADLIPELEEEGEE